MPRQTDYTEEMADRICDMLSEGESMRKICEMSDMPNRSTVLRWMAANEEFAAKCARAREMQADLMDDLILETANACTSETAPADRVKIAAYQWRASKLMPKKYGDKLDLNVNGKLETVPEEQIESRIADLLGKAGVNVAPGRERPSEENK